jgi:hypothetical protein
MALKGLLQFDHADRDLQPEMLADLPWENVKRFFVEQIKVLGSDWFNTKSEICLIHIISIIRSNCLQGV